MTETPGSTLSYDVFVNEPPTQDNGDLPNGERKLFTPTASTLISDSEHAVLTDPGLTIAQAQALGDWVGGKGKKLTDIMITHGHGDHWFNAGILAQRFGARIVATEDTIAEMHNNVGARPFVWDKVYPGIPEQTPVTAVTVPGNRVELEGHELRFVPVGHTDTESTSVIHVPDLDLVVAGDVAYNGAHMFVGESFAVGGLDTWRKALDVVETLGAKHIVAGHQNRALDDDAARVLAESREYLDYADGLLQTAGGALEFFNAMIERYPDHLGRTVLWVGASILYGIREHPDTDPVQIVVGSWIG